MPDKSKQMKCSLLKVHLPGIMSCQFHLSAISSPGFSPLGKGSFYKSLSSYFSSEPVTHHTIAVSVTHLSVSVTQQYVCMCDVCTITHVCSRQVTCYMHNMENKSEETNNHHYGDTSTGRHMQYQVPRFLTYCANSAYNLELTATANWTRPVNCFSSPRC